MSNDKYYRTGISKSYADAMYRFLKKDVEPKFKYFDQSQKWREERFWNKECDQLLQLKLPFLLRLYDYVTDITQKRWYFKLKWISTREFKDFIHRIDITDSINEKETLQIYNLSMQTQIDEITQDRHIRMNIYEVIYSIRFLQIQKVH